MITGMDITNPNGGGANVAFEQPAGIALQGTVGGYTSTVGVTQYRFPAVVFPAGSTVQVTNYGSFSGTNSALMGVWVFGYLTAN